MMGLGRTPTKDGKKRKLSELSPEKMKDGGMEVIKELWKVVQDLQEALEAARAEADEWKRKVGELEERMEKVEGQGMKEREERKELTKEIEKGKEEMEKDKAEMQGLKARVEELKESSSKQRDKREEGSDERQVTEECQQEWELVKRRVERVERVQGRIEKEERRRNIIVTGVAKNQLEEVWKKLEVEVKAVRAIELGGAGSRKVLVEVGNLEDKAMVMRARAKLAGTRIYVGDDLSWEEREVQREIIKRAMEERKKGCQAKVGFRKLVVGQEVWIWKEGGLKKQARLRRGE
jgi:hypothetical protein